MAWNVMEQHISLNTCQINFVVNYISCISCHQQLLNTCYTQDFNFSFSLISNFPVLAFPCLSSCPTQSWDSSGSGLYWFDNWICSTFAKETKFCSVYYHIFFHASCPWRKDSSSSINFDLYKSLMVIAIFPFIMSYLERACNISSG